MCTRSVLLSIVALAWAFPSFAATNSWTKTTSGYWEEPFWSLGVLPSASHEGIAVTNAGFKALAIGPSTVANYPDSLRINNLYVDAPANSGNLLLLNYAGFNVPLSTAATYVGRDGSLLSYYSSLRANTFAVNGKATFAELAETQVGSAQIGTSLLGSLGPGTNSAELTLSNGVFSASQIDIAQGVPGLFNQYGGSNHTQLLRIGTGGSYTLHLGALKVTNTLDLDPGPQGTARLTIAGGTADMTELDMVNGNPQARADVLLSGGTLRATRIFGNNAQLTQSGGRAELGDIKFPFGNGSGTAFSTYSLSNGVLVSSNLLVGVDGTGYFGFNHSGGIHTNLDTLLLSAPAGSLNASTYSLGNGLLVSPRIDIVGGYFSQGYGTNQVGRLSITRGGYYAHGAGEVGDISTNRTEELLVSEGGSYGMVVGAQLWTSNTTVQFEGHVNLMFGHHHVANRLLIDSGGRYTLHSGTLGARYITLEAGGELLLTSGSGTITTNDTVFLRGGGTIAVAYGDYQFGALRVPGNADIDFPTDGPPGSTSTLRFTDAGYTNGALNAELRIQRWTPNVDHLYVGNSPNAITPDQLSLTRFVNPEGYPTGTYRARVLSTGEIVPVELTPLAHARTQNGLVLTWGPNYSLYSSTNVTGPYQQVVPGSSPYTNNFTEPQRFFIVRPIPPLP